MFSVGSDPYGHAESLERLQKLMVSDRILGAKLGRANLKIELEQLLHSRHLADYHVYGAATPHEQPVNFVNLAQDATALAEWFVQKAEEFVTFRRSNP